MVETPMSNEAFINHIPYSPPKYLFKSVFSDSKYYTLATNLFISFQLMKLEIFKIIL